MNKPMTTPIRGEEHWTNKGDDVRLFMWNKCADPSGPAGRILFVHGSSMASVPTFDLQVPGRADSSAMDYFAARGFDTWCVDMEGYGKSTKTRDNNAPISYGADDCFAAATYIQKLRGNKPLLVVRDFVGRAARRAVCPTSSRDGEAARARRPCLDRRGLADARRAQQAACRIPRQESPADRPRLRAFDLHPRPCRHGGRQRDRGICR